MEHLFPFAQHWWIYASFTVMVLGLLALDLGIFHRKAHAVGFREAGIWTAVWISLALLFDFGFYHYSLYHFDGDTALARRLALEFLTGYVVEEALSVDNMFVFVLIFGYFGIQPKYQHRILFYGILGALIFRGIFIAAGAALLQYAWVVYLFGGFLILTGIKMFFSSEVEVDPEKNPIMRFARKFLPVTTEMHGHRFFIKDGHKLIATPLFMTLLMMELTDVVFAIDSVPAIFAITREPLIVFTSNIFAILGLRSMYFLLAGAVVKFHLLRYGLAIILVFVGLKMTWLNIQWGGHFPIGISLAVIGIVLAATIALSLLFPKKESAA